MYQRFKSYFTSPSLIATYINESRFKAFLHYLVFSFLFILPLGITLCMSSTMSPALINGFVDELKTNAEIHYEIDDYKLSSTNGNNELQMIEQLVEINSVQIPLAIIFNPKDVNVKLPNDVEYDTYISVVLGSETCKVIYVEKGETSQNGNINHLANNSNLKLYEKSYQKLGLDNVKFSNVELDSYGLNFNLTKLCNRTFNAIKNSMLPLLLIILAIVGSVMFALNTLIMTVIYKLLYPFIGTNFEKTFKIVLYCSAPYVVFSLLSQLLGIQFISIIGNIITILFTIRASGAYVILNRINKDNE